MRHVIVAVADMHSGHKVGLCNPDVELPDPYGNWQKVTLTRTQEYLWPRYTQWVKTANLWAGEDPVIVLNLSDWINGDHFPEGNMTQSREQQMHVAEANMEPLLGAFYNLRMVRFVTGTPVHDPEGGSPTMVGMKHLSETHIALDIAAYPHGSLTVDGVEIDFAHRGSHPGSRKWLEGNIAAADLRSWLLEDMAHNVPSPRLMLRGHVHTYRHVWVEVTGEPDRQLELFLIPSLCGMTNHARSVMKSSKWLTNGIFVGEIIDGELGRCKIVKETIDLRQREVVEHG